MLKKVGSGDCMETWQMFILTTHSYVLVPESNLENRRVLEILLVCSPKGMTNVIDCRVGEGWRGRKNSQSVHRN